MDNFELDEIKPTHIKEEDLWEEVHSGWIRAIGFNELKEEAYILSRDDQFYVYRMVDELKFKSLVILSQKEDLTEFYSIFKSLEEGKITSFRNFQKTTSIPPYLLDDLLNLDPKYKTAVEKVRKQSDKKNNTAFIAMGVVFGIILVLSCTLPFVL